MSGSCTMSENGRHLRQTLVKREDVAMTVPAARIVFAGGQILWTKPLQLFPTASSPLTIFAVFMPTVNTGQQFILSHCNGNPNK